MQIDFLDELERPDQNFLDDTGTGVAGDTAAPGDEEQVRRLEETGRFRILRRLVHRPVRPGGLPTDGSDLRLGVIVDTETTGLDHARDEVIEIGCVAFTFDDTGIQDVVGTFEALRQPTKPLSSEVSRLTGLTNDRLRGRKIDVDALAAFVRPATIVVAHHAGFDRPFCDRLCSEFRTKPWACSATDVPWKEEGEDSAKLPHLLGSAGFFHEGHRALTDSFAVLEILARRLEDGRTVLSRLVDASRTEKWLIRAEGAPYSERSLLKERGYRWDPGAPNRPKCWHTIVEPSRLSDEIFYLRHEIYRNERLPVVTKVETNDRFRS